MSTAIATQAAGPMVGIGQIAASGDRGIIISALGLGSCIGLVLADRSAGVAGMAHVMLPESGANASGPPGKFADTAVPALVETVVRLGADRGRLVAKIAGGAQMFGAGSGGGLLKIGERNAQAVVAGLVAAGLRLSAGHIGGNSGRTMQVAVESGLVTVKAVGGETIEL